MPPGHLTDGLLKHLRAWKEGRLQPARDRFFAWAHYYDPHDPYHEVPGFTPEDDSDRARYEAELRYTDAEIGRLVKTLKAEGLWENTVVLLTADHGDEFLDHGHRFHGSTLYEEMVHVPLILRVPGLAPRKLDTPIGHLEVVPTLLELMGLEIPPRYLGRSRADEARTGRAPEVQPVYFEVFPDSNYAGHQVGLRLGPLKLIYRITEGYFELYDLATDPQERHNVYDVHPEAPALRQKLLAYVDHHLYWLGQGKTGARLPEGMEVKPKPPKPKPPKPKPTAPKPVRPTVALPPATQPHP